MLYDDVAFFCINDSIDYSDLKINKFNFAFIVFGHVHATHAA